MPLLSPLLASSPRLQKASNNSPPVSIGESNEGVRTLQVALILVGYAMPITTGNGSHPPDGIFGSETLKAVKAFQAKEKLTVDGIVGRDTLGRLDKIVLAFNLEFIQAAIDDLMMRGSLVLPTSPFGATTARRADPAGPKGQPATQAGTSTIHQVTRGLTRGTH